MKSTLSLLILICTLTISTPLYAQLQWEEVTLPEGFTSFAMFPRDSLYCAVIQDGDALKTRDGGATWISALHVSTYRESHAHVNRQGHGIWIVLNSFYRSTNFGASWLPAGKALPFGHDWEFITAVVALTPTRALAVVRGELYETADGFATARLITTPFSDITHAEFTDSLSGCIVSDNSLAWTTDGGETWTPIVTLSDLTGLLALSPEGHCVPSRPWSREDLQLFVSRNPSPVPIDWPTGRAQDIWHRRLEAEEPFREAAAFDPSGSGDLWIACRLGKEHPHGIYPRTSVYYAISPDGSARFLGLGPYVDRMIRTSTDQAWAARFGEDGRARLYRIRMHDALRGLSVRNVSTTSSPGALLTWLDTGME